jgi:hypothetical protein
MTNSALILCILCGLTAISVLASPATHDEGDDVAFFRSLSELKADIKQRAVTVERVLRVIALGTSGTGKSFLMNLLLGHEFFKHDYSPNSVTREREYARIIIDKTMIVVYNVPGLIEADPEKVKLNKRELEAAFAELPNTPAVLLYVFGHTNGRVIPSDVEGVRAVRRYLRKLPVVPEAVIMNNIPASKLTAEYQALTKECLGRTLGELGLLRFIPELTTGKQREDARYQILQLLSAMIPKAQPAAPESPDARLELDADILSQNIIDLKGQLKTVADEAVKHTKMLEEKMTILTAENVRAMQEINELRRIAQESRSGGLLGALLKSVVGGVTGFLVGGPAGAMAGAASGLQDL